ncbi:hypothetical protein EIN_423650 [Entamoeba invadens IP1]|uniref:DUF4371 domain-containing protein n=1 Tax=Entamoeba invadens IP1 TaxID=370355 RepID=A0A0A1UD62_ENTIV|nr:hypothetical protein EIN_423650 [Entamoeba invadens IP1]ELP94294.1 hypothetical protein EIN_423650 [Entamoeba invadens IP1]|eukprot:XP_004261065.1 hypothetical protein EIN_423650 [Entamoeba invadens IP1]
MDEILSAERFFEEHEKQVQISTDNNDDDVEDELLNAHEMFKCVPENTKNQLLEELYTFEDGAFLVYNRIDYKEIDRDAVLESIRRFSYDHDNNFVIERYIVALDYLFGRASNITNIKTLKSVKVMQRKVCDYVMNGEIVKARLRAEQIRALKRCTLVSHATLSRDSLEKAKTLALSSRTVNAQIFKANGLKKEKLKAESSEYKCLAISIDSTTKNEQEIFCVMLRLVKGRKCYSMPIILNQYKGQTDAKTLAKWIIRKIENLGLNTYRIVNCTTDGAATCAGLDGGITVEMNKLIGVYDPTELSLIDSEMKNFWCAAHRVNLMGESLENDVEIKMVKVFAQWFCRKNRLVDYCDKCSIGHGFRTTYSDTRWCYIYKNLDDITNNYEDVSRYIKIPEVLQNLMTEFEKNHITFVEGRVLKITPTKKKSVCHSWAS